METNTENSNATKQRHGSVTAWLILLIISNLLLAISYLFESEMITINFPGEVSTSMIFLLGIIGVGKVIFTFTMEKIRFLGTYYNKYCYFGYQLDCRIGYWTIIVWLCWYWNLIWYSANQKRQCYMLG